MEKTISKYKTLATDIEKYLTDKGVYDKIDTILIQFLVDNMELYDMALDDIRVRGFMVDISKPSEDREYLQVNQAVGVSNQLQKTITAIETKLGLTVLDRTKLKLTDAKKVDQLDEMIWRYY